MKILIKREIAIVILILAALVLAGGGLFYVFEGGINSDVGSYWDGVWLAASTASSVGYGDVYPVTASGRLLSSILGFSGLLLIGVTSALATSYLLRVRGKG